jgi:hypothetical protein
LSIQTLFWSRTEIFLKRNTPTTGSTAEGYLTISAKITNAEFVEILTGKLIYVLFCYLKNSRNPEPRKNEDGGAMGKKVIVAHLTPNSVMTSRVQITAHHKGYIQFHYCAQNNQVLTAQELENCFQSNVLQIQGQGDKFSVPEPSAADYADQGYWYDVPVMIPNVECSRCVLRWTYHAGNGWGCDAPDDCGIGKGYQEEFKNCADVMISNDGTPPTTTTTTTTTTTNTGPTTTTTTGTTTTTTKDPMTFCDPWQETWERRGLFIYF